MSEQNVPAIDTDLITYHKDAQYNEELDLSDRDGIAEALERLVNIMRPADVVCMMRVCVGKKRSANAGVELLSPDGETVDSTDQNNLLVNSGLNPNTYTGEYVLDAFEYLSNRFDVVWDYKPRSARENEVSWTMQIAKDEETLDKIRFPFTDKDEVGIALSYPEPDVWGNHSDDGLFDPIKRGYYHNVVPFERGMPIRSYSPYRFALYTPACSRESYERYFDRNMSLFNAYVQLSSIYGGIYLQTNLYTDTGPLWIDFWRTYFKMKAYIFGTQYTPSLFDRVREYIFS